MVMLWISGFVLELTLAGIGVSGKLRQGLAFIIAIYVIISTALSLGWFSYWFAIVICLFLPFRLLNISRSIQNRMHVSYLRRVSARTSVWLIVIHALAYVLVSDALRTYWMYFPVVMLLVAAGMFGLVLFHIRKTRHIKNTNHFSDKDLPTVSVCIPARNETDALERCLRSVLANDYPKLEILVLDDCSQDRTAEIIKSFAHQGVRFVQGDEPQERWLAKNQAYNKLATEANGDLLLFCGVDVRFGPHAVKSLVSTMLNRQKSMISVLPLRFYSKLSDSLVQPMRYWWELIPPRKLFRRPAVLSTCWLVSRKQLKKAGGFSAVSHAIIPEGYFARHFIQTDSYSFIRADEELDIRTAKPFEEQWNTAIRTNYPQIRRRPEMALVLTAFTCIFMLLPFVLLVHAVFSQNLILLLISWATCSLLIFTHVSILRVSDPANAPIGFFTMPVAALVEMLIGHVSMIRYEFGRVDWKDRNICVPVMHTVPQTEFLKQLTED